MDNNDTTITKVPRKIYSRELLRSLQHSELSSQWPKILDQTCINSHNQWDPVKSFENNKSTETTKRTIFPENKIAYRNNNDKSKDDISLRPERRRWNDGCQVTNNNNNNNTNNKRNNEDLPHSNSYRKSYQNTIPNCGGGDYDRNRFNRNSNRNNKSKETDTTTIKANNNLNLKQPEKSSRNNSNLDERKDEKDIEKIHSKNIGNNSRFNRGNNNNTEPPEWFLDGPENCEETIELRGISANDNEMLHFKVCSSTKQEERGKEKQELAVNNEKLDKVALNLSMEKSSILGEVCVSPKREGSRFQDIFMKEKKINNMNESKDVENILKAVLSDNVSKSDAERLNNVSKPLPNGVLTLEEIEKNMTLGAIHMDRTSKSTTIDTLNSFEPSLNSLLSSGLSSPNQDNSKVVNWLSGLNLHAKDPEIDIKQYNEIHNFCNLNTMINPTPQISTGYSKFINNLQPPPGLPLMLNNNQLQQHTQLIQQQQQQQQQQHSKIIQSPAIMKHLQMSQPNNGNHNIQSRNILPYMFQSHNQLNEFDSFISDKCKLNNQPNMPTESHLDQTILSNYLFKNKPQMNHINHERNHILSMNGPPGLTNLNMIEKNMIMQPRPIVKTSSPQLFDMNAMNEFKNYQTNFAYQRSISANNPLQMQQQNLEMNKTVHMNNQIELLKNLRNRELQMHHQAMLMNNNYSNRQSFIPSAHEMNIQNSSSNKMLANLFSVSPSTLPPLPQAKYADQIETENI